MSQARSFTPFSKILVPIIQGCDPTTAIQAASCLAGKILIVGLVRVSKRKSLSTAASAVRSIRKIIQSIAEEKQIRSLPRVHVSYSLWRDLYAVIEEEDPDLLILEWPRCLKPLDIDADTLLKNAPCNTALIRGPLNSPPDRILAAVRGGPNAELAIRLSLAMSTGNSHVTALHLIPTAFDENDPRDAPFHGLSRVIAHLPDVGRLQVKTDDPAARINRESENFDLVIMGSTARSGESSVSLGPVANSVFRKSSSPVIAVKAKKAEMTANLDQGKTAISILVDKWFAESTYHTNEFKDLEKLLLMKEEQKLTISVAMPTLNEQATVKKVIRTIKRALMDTIPLVDEIVLIDSNSTDATREIAKDCGIPVYIHQDILPLYGGRSGKGEALWKSLYVTRGDLLVWVDTDITNIHASFVYGLIGVLLFSSKIQFVKGFYRRPLRVGDQLQAGGGGRVTELAARPLLNLFYPELSGIIQPLSGEYGGRRSLLERLTFYSGYGVEVGLLIEALEIAGLDSIAQVDLKERIHRNQSLEPLSKMSFAIIQTIIGKLEKRMGRNLLEDINKTMKLIHYERNRYFLDVQEIEEKDRPPMIEIPEYKKRHHR